MIFNVAFCNSDPLDDIIDDLIVMRKQKEEIAQAPTKHPFSIYQRNADTYAHKFIDFLNRFKHRSEQYVIVL